MQVLSYGYKLPEDGDTGWWDYIEDNISRLNAHDHDGVDSALLNSTSFSRPVTTIDSDDWTNDENGNYSYLVTVPSGISNASIQDDNKYYALVILDANKDRIYPTIEWESADTFTVRVNDNTLDLTIYYV